MSGRVLVVTNDFPPRTGGIESFVLALSRLLPAERLVVHTARQPGDAEFDAHLPFEVVRDPAPLLVPTPAITRRVIGTARRFGLDRVWFGAAAPLALMGAALRQAGMHRLVATTHGHEVWWATLPGSRQALRAIGERTDVVTYLGEYTRSRIGPALGAQARARMAKLTPGVDSGHFTPDADGGAVRARHGLGSAPVVVCVSRLVTRKGQDALIRALPAVRQVVPDTRLLLVGDGPARGRLQRLVRGLGLEAAVVLAGRRPWHDTAGYYAAADVFAMPTRTRLAGLEPEALGICYLEAAACALPVVAGDSGGAPDAVLDGQTGFVVNGSDVAAVSDRLITLLTDRDLASDLGRRGREWVRRDWGWQQQADTLAHLLDL